MNAKAPKRKKRDVKRKVRGEKTKLEGKAERGWAMEPLRCDKPSVANPERKQCLGQSGGKNATLVVPRHTTAKKRSQRCTERARRAGGDGDKCRRWRETTEKGMSSEDLPY